MVSRIIALGFVMSRTELSGVYEKRLRNYEIRIVNFSCHELYSDFLAIM